MVGWRRWSQAGPKMGGGGRAGSGAHPEGVLRGGRRPPGAGRSRLGGWLLPGGHPGPRAGGGGQGGALGRAMSFHGRAASGYIPNPPHRSPLGLGLGVCGGGGGGLLNLAGAAAWGGALPGAAENPAASLGPRATLRTHLGFARGPTPLRVGGWVGPAPLSDIPSGCCSFTGPWTFTRSSFRMLRRVAAFCRPLRPLLLLVSFPPSRSPVVVCWGCAECGMVCRLPVSGAQQLAC